MISAYVLTLNEAANLKSCLASIAFCDEVFVVDSGSQDGTQAVAEALGATVVDRRLTDWAEHGNWILQNIPFANPYVLYMDADEVMTIPMRQEVLKALAAEDPCTAYQFRYQVYLFGRPLKHGGVSDVWVTRLFRPDAIRYEQREVNAHPIVRGSIGRISEPYEHHTFSKGMHAWLEKHNSYSSMEAREALTVTHDGLIATLRKPGSVRRRIKNVSFHLPLRGLLRFCYTYVLRRGFLDGVPGFWYAACIATYESWLGVKVEAGRKGGPTAIVRIESEIREMLDNADGISGISGISGIGGIRLRLTRRLVRRLLRTDPMTHQGWRPHGQRDLA